MSMVMPRRFSSSNRSASMPVRAFTSAVFPWSMCPAVPTMMFFMPLVLILLGFPLAAQQTPTDTPVFSAGDFLVFDDGRPQKLAHFGREAEHVDLLLLLDVSGSMHRFLEEMAASARAALAPLGAGDRVAVMLFSREAAVRQPFTQDFAAVQAQIRQAVEDRSLGSGTAINAAIIAAAQYLEQQPVRGRRAILIVTDNQMLNYQVPDEAVTQELYRADAVLNAILIGKQLHPDPGKPGRYRNPDFTPPDVFKLAGETGGELIEERKSRNSFAEMIERLRARYALAYDAPPGGKPGEFHAIRVELSPEAQRRYPRAIVRARAGYFAEK